MIVNRTRIMIFHNTIYSYTLFLSCCNQSGYEAEGVFTMKENSKRGLSITHRYCPATSRQRPRLFKFSCNQLKYYSKISSSLYIVPVHVSNIEYKIDIKSTQFLRNPVFLNYIKSLRYLNKLSFF